MTYNLYYVIMIQIVRMHVNIFIQKYSKKTYQSINNACLSVEVLEYIFIFFSIIFCSVHISSNILLL